MKKIIFLVLFMAISAVAISQNTNQKWKFHSINSIGLLYGENGSSFTMSSVNGFKKNGLSLGIGINFDTYLYNTLPVFADIRKEFGKKPWKPFAYFNIGANIPLPNASLPKRWSSGLPAYDLKTRLFTELGVGFETSINKSNAFVLQIGYSQKNFGYTESLYMNPLSSFMPPINEFDYYYRRIVVKMGLSF